MTTVPTATRRSTFAAGLIACIVSSLTALAAPPATQPARSVQRDINYGDGSIRSQALDLYLPNPLPAGKLPLVIYVHGGGWMAGDKSATTAQGLVTRGYAVASINYRLSTEARYPAQIEDCKAAVRWLRAQAGRFHLDPDRFAATGDSAGGHLVALLGTTGGVKELEGHVGKHLDVSSKVQCVVDWYGPTDMSVYFDQAGPENILKANNRDQSPLIKLFGGTVEQKPDLVQLANPIHFIKPGVALPPFLIQHGDADTIVPVGQSRILAEALKKAGAEVEFHVIPGAGHGFGPKDDVLPALLTFLDEHLKPGT